MVIVMASSHWWLFGWLIISLDQSSVLAQVSCYDCSNRNKTANFCRSPLQLEQAVVVKCPNKCIYLAGNLDFIEERIYDRGCAPDNKCRELRLLPGLHIRQCIMCGTDLCNHQSNLVPYSMPVVLIIALYKRKI